MKRYLEGVNSTLYRLVLLGELTCSVIAEYNIKSPHIKIGEYLSI